MAATAVSPTTLHAQRYRSSRTSTTPLEGPGYPCSSTPSDICSISDEELKDRLHFIKEIGYGNWGSVWSCYTKNTPTREKVAVKLVHRSKTPTTAARVKSLWNEMKIHRSFRHDAHPSIVSFHSFVITPSYALITMDYLPRLIPVEVHESKAKKWFESLLGGIHFLHAHKVSHNDIKPANILLTSTQVPVLVDFGFAEYYPAHKVPKEKAFLSNLAYGTPEYLSPERAKGLQHDTRLSDVYSLAVTFFEILVGRTPFEAVEGEAFETQEDLQRYWERTKQGKWLGEEDWRGRMSVGLRGLLEKMMCPEVGGRIDTAGALADPYWSTEYGVTGDLSFLASPPGLERVDPSPPTPPKLSAAGVAFLDDHANATDSPSRPPTPVTATPKPAKKKSRSKLQKKPSGSPSTPKTKRRGASKSPLRKDKPSLSSIFNPLSPANAKANTPRAHPPSASKSKTSAIPVSTRRPIASIYQPHPKVVVPNGVTKEDSDKENTMSRRRKGVSPPVARPVSQASLHAGRKVPSRKPIPAALQNTAHKQGSSLDKSASGSRTPSALDYSAAASSSMSKNARRKSSALDGLGKKPARTSFVSKESLQNISLILGEETSEPPGSAKEDEGVLKHSDSRDFLQFGGISGRTANKQPKPVLDLVREMKASMKARQAALQDQTPPEAPEFSISQLVMAPPPEDMAVESPRLYQDNYLRPGKDSTPVTIFKHSVRASMDKLRLSTAAGPSKQSRASVSDIRTSWEDIGRDEVPGLNGGERRSADSETDRMELWLKSISRAVEETRTNFQNEAKASGSRLPALPPRIIPQSPSKRAQNKVHPVKVVDSPSGKRRRTTIASIGGSTSPAMVLNAERRDSAPEEIEQSTLGRSTLGFSTTGRSVSMRTGAISPIAHIEEEIHRSQASAPRRLSAVLNDADVTSRLAKGKAKENRTSAETEAPSIDSIIPPLPVVEVVDVSPPPSPASSLSDTRRKSASSIMLLDRRPSTAGVLHSKSSWEFHPKIGERPNNSGKDYDQVLMSSSGVVKVGRGYQSNQNKKRDSTLEYRFVPPVTETVNKSHRYSLFKSSSGIAKHSEPPSRSTSSAFRTPTKAKVVKSMDHLTSAKRPPVATSGLLKVPGTVVATPSEGSVSVGRRVRQAIVNILQTPRRNRTIRYDH